MASGYSYPYRHITAALLRPSPPLSPYVEWSAEYNDYLVFYSEDGAGEDEEDEHSAWTWLKSVVSLVDGPMADGAEEPARGTGARGAQGR